MAVPKKIGSSPRPQFGIGTAAISRTPKGQGHVDAGGVTSRKKPDRFAAGLQRLAMRKR